MPPKTHLLINEIYGPTFSGEGPTLGRPCSFIRLAGCNLDCIWCDTSQTWDFPTHNRDAEVHKMSVDEVVAQATKLALKTPLMLISGGEPMLQQSVVADVINQVYHNLWSMRYELGYIPETPHWEVQTNGTILPLEYITELEKLGNVTYIVSPKLSHALLTRQKPVDIDAWVDHRAYMKFVCRNEDDLEEVSRMVGDFPRNRIWIMPEGTQPDDVIKHQRAIAEGVIARGWNLTTRLHTLIWGNERQR